MFFKVVAVRSADAPPPPSLAVVARWCLARWPLLLGLAAVLLPTLARLGRLSWSTESGAHGPIVLATGLWLLWRDRAALRDRQRQPLLPALLVLLLALPVFVVGRITSILAIECGGLYVALLAVAYLQLGPAVLKRLWFPCVYFLFLITPPENWLFVATRPIKMAISVIAVDFLSLLGFAVGSTGVMIQIDGYQLLVATACSGINSLIGICALGLFYVHLRHGSVPRYALLLTALVLPIAIAANFVRIIILILITHYAGEAAGQGISHEMAGMGMFLLAMLLLIALDSVLYPFVQRRKVRR